MVVVKFRATQKFSPLAKEILKEAARLVYGDEQVQMVPAKSDDKFIDFGGRSGIRALSPKQLVSAANALTSLERSFRLYREDVSLPEFRYYVVTEDTFDIAIINLRGCYATPIAVDIENAPDKRVLSISVNNGEGSLVFPEELCQGTNLGRIVGALASCYYIVGANWKYDAGVLYDHTGIMVPVWFDTMLAHHSLHPGATGQHGLKEMAQSILGIDDWDTPLKKYTGSGKNADFSKVPPELLYKYNGFDTHATFLLHEYMLPLVESHDAFWREVSWSNAFAYVEANRVHIDVPYVETLRDELMAQEEEYFAAVLAAVSTNPFAPSLDRGGKAPTKAMLAAQAFNPGSPKQLLEVLKRRGLNIKDTGADTLKEYASDERAADIIEPLLAYRRAQKMRSTYCDAYLRFVDEHGYIRPTFNIHTTATGRLSGSDPNVTNVPRDKRLRRIFTASSDERVLIECDYAQAELRAQAILSNDPDMIAAFQPDSPDFFDGLMPAAFPEKYPTLEDYLRYEEEECGGDEKDDRAKMKGVVYGLNFGRGAAAIAEALTIPVKDAQAIIDNFCKTYPTWYQWREGVLAASVDPEQSITGWWGLSFESEVVSWRNESAVKRSALSFLPQNTVVGLGATAVQRLVRQFNLRPELNAKLTFFVHDAIYVECPRSVAHEVGRMVGSTMTQVGRDVFGDVVLFTADAKAMPYWGAKEGAYDVG